MRRVAVLLACLLATTALGAPPPDAATGRDRARTYLMQRVVDALALSDEKAVQMRDILRRADERRLELTQQREALDAKLRTALAESPVDTAKLGPLVADAHTVQRDLAALPERTFEESRRILTVEQQAKFLLFRRDLQGEVRQAIRRRAASATHHGR